MEELIAEEEAEFDQMLKYINKIKDRFGSDRRVCQQFLKMLIEYRKNKKGIAEVCTYRPPTFSASDWYRICDSAC